MLEQCRWALRDEVKAIREGGGQRTYLSDGRYIGQRPGYWVYSFTADSELRLADDTRVDLEYRGQKHPAIILSTHGFDIVLALESDLGGALATAVLYTAPWYLLEELQQRLVELDDRPAAQQGAVSTLIGDLRQHGPLDEAGTRALLKRATGHNGGRLSANDHQIRAIAHIRANHVSFIWGPPGTGKTRTLGLAAAALLAEGQSVLLVAHSNVAVDVAMLQVAGNMERTELYKQGRLLRFGIPYLDELGEYPLLQLLGVLQRLYPAEVARLERLEKERSELVRLSRKEQLGRAEGDRLARDLDRVRTQIDDLRAQLKLHESGLLHEASLIGCTLSKATIAAEVYGRRFDTVLLDEASMAYIPHGLLAAGLAHRAIAVFGDFRQLAPISQGDTPNTHRWLERDLFDFAGIIERVNLGRADSRLVLLAEQYRMHPAIASIPNRLFYGGRLKDAPGLNQTTQPIVDLWPSTGSPLLAYDTAVVPARSFAETESHSRFNLLSALIAAEVAYAAQRHDLPIGVITPYNAQARLISRLVRALPQSHGRNASVATVHRFQGSESDLILFDLVDTAPMKPGRPFAIDDDGAARLVNVAVSRAKGKFILLGDFGFVRRSYPDRAPLRALVEAVTRDGVRQVPAWATPGHGLLGSEVPGITYFNAEAPVRAQIEHDLEQTRQEVAVLWSADVKPPFAPHALLNSGTNTRFFISGTGMPRFQIGLRNARLWEGRAVTGVSAVGLDRKTLWLFLDPGAPASRAVRLDLPATAMLLYAFLRLIPDDELRLITPESALAAGKSPVGMPCPLCASPLWLAEGKYGAHLACTATTCGYTKRVTAADATNLTRLMGLTCPRCAGQAIGRGSAAGGVFIGCANYPTCRWTRSLDELV
jgi:hypothetical protein